MSNVIADIIKYQSENHALDYKELQYPIGSHPTKNEILKDISAMANHPENCDKYIIIGVTETDGMASGFKDVTDLIDESKYQQLVQSNIEPNINFEYKSVQHDGHQLAYFRIFKNNQRPYLFKREVSNGSKVEFKVGDGFIRTGSSTRKLVRDDFETMYRSRYTVPDRKGDIHIIPYVKKCDDSELSDYNLSIVDIMIVNNSNRSIDLDIEMLVNFSGEIIIISQSELKKELHNQRIEERREKSLDINIFNSSPPLPSFDVSVKKFDKHIVAYRNKRNGSSATVSIAQVDKEEYTFCKEIIVLSKSAGIISGEVIVRSNDFSEGLLKIPFKLEYLG